MSRSPCQTLFWSCRSLLIAKSRKRQENRKRGEMLQAKEEEDSVVLFGEYCVPIVTDNYYTTVNVQGSQVRLWGKRAITTFFVSPLRMLPYLSTEYWP